MKASIQYRDDWLSVLYDATGDYVKSKRAMELAELNGLFDSVDAIDGASPSFDITDDALNAHLRATGEWVNPYEAETESGMEIECGMPQEAADQINAEQRELLRKGYVAAFSVSSTDRATGFFAQLTPEQQKAALEYDGPENHGNASFSSTEGNTHD